MTSLDDALLADDSALDRQRRQFCEPGQSPQVIAGSEAAAGLTAAARLWLGSSFCARHILHNLASPAGLPAFWTRGHRRARRLAPGCCSAGGRHDLQQIKGQFAGTAEPMVRGFCVPEDAVTSTARWERILFLLSVALMDALEIRVKISTDPEYADIDGFVVLPGNRAVIATWVRAESAWHANCVGRGPAVSTFTDVTGHVTAHSVTEAPTQAGRLAALAAYLGLDWSWLWRRCAGLAEHGCAGLARPRSRLLSTEALDATLRFSGNAGRSTASR